VGADRYAPFLARVATTWPASGLHQTVEGTLVFADVSGFTALSERLAKRGKVGAELLTDLLDAVFEQLLDAALDLGGDLLAFGGDALCLLFTGAGHEARGAAAARELQRRLRHRTPAHGAIGRFTLGMSIGAESGPIHLLRAGSGPYEHLALGATVSATLACEGAAERGEILVGPALAERLGAAVLARESERTLLTATPAVDAVPAVESGPVDPFLVPAWLRGLVDEGTPASHRPATIGFVKLQGTDHVIDMPAGPTEIDHAITEMQHIAAQAGVSIIATDVYPDAVKVLCATGVPASSPDDTERMLEAGRAFSAIDVPLSIHVGINRGRLYAGPVGGPRRRTYTVMGDTVNLAARLMARAGPGTVVATAHTLDASRRPFARRPLEPFLVKGKAKPIDAAEVGPPGGDPTARAAVVGRAGELELLRDAWHAAGSGRGGVVDVVAPPGMGKSALIATWRSTLPADVPVFVAEGGVYGRGSPYRALIPALLRRAAIPEHADEATQGRKLVEFVAEVRRDLLPWVPLLAIAFGIDLEPTPETSAIAPEFRRRRLAELVVELMTALFRDPTVLLVENAQWIDDASTELIAALARAVPTRPWLMVVGRRPGADALDTGPATTTLDLEALDESAARELIAEVTDRPLPEPSVQALVSRAAGNPLLLGELARATAAGRAIDDLPESVESLVGAEIDVLPPARRVLLRRAAVLGLVFPVGLLEALGGPEYDHIGQLDRFLLVDGEQLRFRHSLLREAAYETLSYRERIRMHGEAAVHIEAAAGAAADEEAELLSLHHFHAHAWERALHFSEVAADRARSDVAPVEAAAFYRRALEAARRCDSDRRVRARLEEALAGVLEQSGLYAEARAALRRARRLVSDPVDRARLLLADGRIEEATGRYPLALGLYSRATRWVTQAPDGPTATAIRAQLIVERAGIRYRQGRYRACADLLLGALDAELGEATDAQRGRALYLLDSALSDLRLAGDHEYAHDAVKLLRRAGELALEASVWNNLGVEAYFDGDLTQSRSYYERCEELCTRVGDVVQAATATNNIGELLSDAGDYEAARQAFEHARRVFLGAGYSMGAAVAMSNLGRLEIRCGHPERAAAPLDEAAAVLASIGAASFLREVDGRRAEMLIALDRPRDALELIEDLARAADAAGERAVLGEWLDELRERAGAALDLSGGAISSA
jgi:class 3 adenylate cyclase/predicted ATPase